MVFVLLGVRVSVGVAVKVGVQVGAPGAMQAGVSVGVLVFAGAEGPGWGAEGEEDFLQAQGRVTRRMIAVKPSICPVRFFITVLPFSLCRKNGSRLLVMRCSLLAGC
jgi:hypothetical protein